MNRNERHLAILCTTVLLFVLVILSALSGCGRNKEPAEGTISVQPSPVPVITVDGSTSGPAAGTTAGTTAAESGTPTVTALLELRGIPSRATADPFMLQTRTELPLDTTTTTTTTTTAAPSSNTVTVTTDTANVRADAGADFKLVTVIRKGEHYPVLEQKDAANGVRWFKIRLGDGGSGWVCCNYVSFDGQLSGLRAYLTFDDGPSDNTRKILDILDRYHVKATFFVIYHGGCEDIYKDIVNRGHTIALHSYSHEYGDIYRSEDAYFKDLSKLDDYVGKVTGVHPKYLRFPGGSSNTISRKYCSGIMTKLTKSVTDKGYYYYDWNVDSGDADGNKIAADKLVDNVKKRIGNTSNAVLLMHDTSAKTTTVDALPRIIEFLQSKGYRLLPIDETTVAPHHTINN